MDRLIKIGKLKQEVFVLYQKYEAKREERFLNSELQEELLSLREPTPEQYERLGVLAIEQIKLQDESSKILDACVALEEQINTLIGEK